MDLDQRDYSDLPMPSTQSDSLGPSNSISAYLYYGGALGQLVFLTVPAIARDANDTDLGARQKPVGWTCTISMSRYSGPRRNAIAMPSQVLSPEGV